MMDAGVKFMMMMHQYDITVYDKAPGVYTWHEQKEEYEGYRVETIEKDPADFLVLTMAGEPDEPRLTMRNPIYYPNLNSLFSKALESNHVLIATLGFTSSYSCFVSILLNEFFLSLDIVSCSSSQPKFLSR